MKLDLRATALDLRAAAPDIAKLTDLAKLVELLEDDAPLFVPASVALELDDDDDK